MSKLFKIVLPLLLVLGLALAVGCAAKESPPMPPSAPMPSALVEKGYQGASYSATGGEGSATTIDRKIVRTGNLTLEVDNVIKAIGEVAGVAEGLGGYVVSSNRQGEEEKPTGRVSIRVPLSYDSDLRARLRPVVEELLQVIGICSWGPRGDPGAGPDGSSAGPCAGRLPRGSRRTPELAWSVLYTDRGCQGQ